MVEFALVAPMFFLLLFGIVEAGRFIFYYETLSNATREGARYAIVNGANTLGCPSGPPAPGSSAVRRAGQRRRHTRPPGRLRRARRRHHGRPLLVVHGLRLRRPTATDNGAAATVTVTASYTYSSLIPLVPLPPITVTAESSLVVNN